MLDRRYLHALVETYCGGPVGVDTLAAALAEARDAIEDVIEPLPDAARLRHAHAARPLAAPKAYERLGKKPPPMGVQQGGLFESGD